MNILLTGGTGFIGRALNLSLLNEGCHLTVLSRQSRAKVAALLRPSVRVISGFSELDSEETFECVINLCGENIADKRWTSARKKILLTSRIGVTEELVQWLKSSRHKPSVLISASAVGYYGDRADLTLTERTAGGLGFPYELCHRWERAAGQVQDLGMRVCMMRFGVVLGPDGGMIKQLLPLFKWGLGTIPGSGRQWLSWVHLDDVVGAIRFAIKEERLSGPVNCVAPEPVTQADFSRALGKAVKRPVVLSVPAFALKLMLGERARLLLDSAKVVPEKLTQCGYSFLFPTLERALANVVEAR